jgi:hypothetical protein
MVSRFSIQLFADNNICMVWSQLAELRSTPPIATTDFLYLRFIGDRTIDEKDFGKVQKKDPNGRKYLYVFLLFA